MKAIRITEERMAEVLPSQIRNTDVLTDNAKKTLATLMNYFSILNIAKTSGFLVCPNNVLREAAGIRNNDLVSAVQELIDCDLIERQVGQKRVEGKKAMASTYVVKWKNLVNPIKKKNTFEELFAEFLKSSETPLGTTDTESDTESDTDDVDESVNVSVYESVYDNVSVCDYVDVNENANAIGNSCNSNQILIDFVNKQLEGKMTYDEVKKQITPIQDFIKSNWSKDNVERMTEISNKLINEKFKEIETVKTDTVHVN